MIIKQVTRINKDVAETFKRLIPQLVGRNDYPSFEILNSIVNSENVKLLVAVEDDKIVGSLSIVLYLIPTGKKAIIEDVVVDESARGKGVASKLMDKAIEIASENGVRKIELTSTPTRIAANKMYAKCGFKVRDTNFYRLDLE